MANISNLGKKNFCWQKLYPFCSAIILIIMDDQEFYICLTQIEKKQ